MPTQITAESSLSGGAIGEDTLKFIGSGEDYNYQQPSGRKLKQFQMPNGTTIGATVSSTAASINHNDLIRSSAKLKQFIQNKNRTGNNDYDMLMHLSQFQDITYDDLPRESIERKFDTPGPGHYEINGQFTHSTARKSESSKHNRFKTVQTTSDSKPSTHRIPLPQTAAFSTDRSNLSNTINLTTQRKPNSSLLLDQSHRVISARDSNFGLAFQQLQRQYFKEYQIELVGKHSPGPGVYSPKTTCFSQKKHDSKSFTNAKRECPLVPREQILKGDLSPMTYNLQDKNTAFEKPRSILKYFGTKAQRHIDIRLFGQAHADSVKIGWH